MANSQSNSGLDQCHNRGVRRKQVANPTTNYGFVLPTPTDLVTDLPADFEVALQGVDTTLKALQPGTTLGDLAYSSATANTNTRLAVGSTGDVLTVAGGVPTWAAPAAAGGKVLQVVSGVTTTVTTIATTALTDTTITATITPTLATSKILVIASVNIFIDRGAAFNSAIGRLLRGATTIADYPTAYFGNITATGASGVSLASIFGITYLDEPATTSATTYKIQSATVNTTNSGTVNFQAGNGPSTITLLEIGA
jgi:hypothetical protein